MRLHLSFSQKYLASISKCQSVSFSDALCLKRFLKIARVSAYGAIIIDAEFVEQKVRQARDTDGNVEKVAYGSIIVAAGLTGHIRK